MHLVTVGRKLLTVMTLSEWAAGVPSAKTKLARQLGIRWQTVQYWIEGRATPGLKMARRIEEATDGAVTVYDLCRDDEEAS